MYDVQVEPVQKESTYQELRLERLPTIGEGERHSYWPETVMNEKPLAARIFRLPVEMSCVSVETMFPYHTATASALLNSMLSATPRNYGWTLEDCNDDL
ncbi:hypothetical protein RDI58_029050 [Solanum bulbocastanum]|uniref:Uncharacterized protein n=1 Tax=Solanum bulbocastanum TaxID=147425 RepID=A0AAN8SXD2_SOLBU